jgi:pyridoxal phosphate enzyme (YggS family)
LATRVTDTSQSLAGNIANVRDRIARACERAGRNTSDVTLIAVSKAHPPSAVAEAQAAGLADFGENRVQEASAKILELRADGVTPNWHLIGHLQRNKAAAAVGLFDIIHSVDSYRLAEAIAKNALASTRVLLEVNTGGESSKFGVPPDEAPALAERIGRLHHVDLVGLMTVAPETDDPERVRPYFRRLRELRGAIGLSELSMGMTGDFEVAIEEGATFVRIGRAIFGARTT